VVARPGAAKRCSTRRRDMANHCRRRWPLNGNAGDTRRMRVRRVIGANGTPPPRQSMRRSWPGPMTGMFTGDETGEILASVTKRGACIAAPSLRAIPVSTACPFRPFPPFNRGSCREGCGNSRSAPPGGFGMTRLRLPRQGRRVREAGPGFPSHRPCASGSGRTRARPTDALARSAARAEPSAS